MDIQYFQALSSPNCYSLDAITANFNPNSPSLTGNEAYVPELYKVIFKNHTLNLCRIICTDAVHPRYYFVVH